jgi:hypothetical protein
VRLMNDDECRMSMLNSHNFLGNKCAIVTYSDYSVRKWGYLGSMSKHRMIENAHPLKVPRRSRSVRRWTLCDPGKSGKMSVNEYLTVMKMSAADRLSRERTYRFQARNAEVWQAWRSG